MPIAVTLTLILCPVFCAVLSIFYQYASSKVAGIMPTKPLLFLSGIFGLGAGLLIDAFVLGVFDEVLGLTDRVM